MSYELRQQKVSRVARTLLHVPAVHVFHAQNDVPGFILKRSIEGNDVGGTAVVADL